MSVSVLIVPPGSITPEDRELLRADGNVVIETDDPSSIRMLAPEPQAISGNAMLYAALHAMCGPSGDVSVRGAFTRQLHELMPRPPHDPR